MRLKTHSLVGQNIRRLRMARGWSQEELARRAGVSSVAMLESGARQNPRTSTLRKIAQAMDIDISTLMRDLDFVASPEELVRLLESRMAGDVTGDEVEELKRWRPASGKPTAEAYYLYLQAIRATKTVSD